jgi:hypothetical protein
MRVSSIALRDAVEERPEGQPRPKQRQPTSFLYIWRTEAGIGPRLDSL